MHRIKNRFKMTEQFYLQQNNKCFFLNDFLVISEFSEKVKIMKKINRKYIT